MPTVPPLLRLLRSLTPEQRAQLAKDCDTTPQYLYQVAGQDSPNPRLRLAMALVEQSKTWSTKLRSEMRRKGIPADIISTIVPEPLDYPDLLVGPNDASATGSDAGGN